MKNSIVAFLSNRIGIVLAGLNLCYFAARNFDLKTNALPHGQIVAAIIYSANFCALVLSALPSIFVDKRFPALSVNLHQAHYRFFFGICILVQWLTIAAVSRWLAKQIHRLKAF
jgi:hypothetical protein